MTGIAVSLLASVLAAAPAAPAPNIVLIYGDDIGYGDFGCYGGTGAPTPNVDALARGGLRFTEAYASSATCTPSRYSLLTGEYAFRKRGTGVLPGDAPLIIEPGRATLPSLLRQQGYRTGAVGKWHLGLGTKEPKLDWNGRIAPGPLEVGFDYCYIMAATGDRVPCVYVEDHKVVGLSPADPISVNYDNAYPNEPNGVKDRATLKLDWSHGHNMAVVNGVGRIGYMKGGKSALWKDEDMADTFTRKGLDFIEREKSHPFFLYLALHDVHVPRMPHPRFKDKSTMGPRGDALVQFDACVGEVTARLEKLGLLQNTLIMLTSDNGPVLDDGYKDQANQKVGQHHPSGPFRAGKYSSFEGGTRIPFIVYWQGKVQPGTSSAILSQVDLPVTLAALAGNTNLPSTMPDSQNQLSALLGQSSKGRDHVVEYARNVALREGDWKYIPPGVVQDKLGPWQQVQVPAPGMLFNLSKDPGETNNLASAEPQKLAQLRKRLKAIHDNAED